jgi:hypothetical protein
MFGSEMDWRRRSRTNVLLVVAAEWPSALFGHAAHQVIQTPTIDELAEWERFPRRRSNESAENMSFR